MVNRQLYFRRYNAGRRDQRRDRSRRERGLPDATRPVPEACECCGRLPGTKPLMLDHCHDTGAFRGWICVNCNLGIGMLGDTAGALRRALAYIQGMMS